MINILPISKVIKQFPNINYVMYADDIQLYRKIPTCSIDMPYELTLRSRNVIKWLNLNTFFLNSSKTKLLNITRNPLFSLILPLILLLSFKVIEINLSE